MTLPAPPAKPPLELQFFHGLAPAAVQEIRRLGRERKIQAEAYLYQQDDEADHLFSLLTGRIRLAQLAPDGQQVILHLVSPGETFGVIAALAGLRYPVSAQAIDDSTLLAWDQTTILALMHRYPELAINGMSALTGRVQELQDRLRELTTEKVERRIARTLLRLARQAGRKTAEGVLIDLSLSRQDLAEMTGTTLFTVSRTLSRWETIGLVKTGREQVIIRFPHGLVMIAEDTPPRTSARPAPAEPSDL